MKTYSLLKINRSFVVYTRTGVVFVLLVYALTPPRGLVHICPEDSMMRREDFTSCSLVHVEACRRICDRSLTYAFGNLGGFGSEFNWLLLSYLYSILSQRRLIIDSSGWNFGDYQVRYIIFMSNFLLSLSFKSHCL